MWMPSENDIAFMHCWRLTSVCTPEMTNHTIACCCSLMWFAVTLCMHNHSTCPCAKSAVVICHFLLPVNRHERCSATQAVMWGPWAIWIRITVGSCSGKILK